MNTSNSDIESIKVKFENDLLAMKGVETISVGFRKDGSQCLMIGLSLPEDLVKPSLPAEIFSVPVEFMFVGSINAQ